MFTLYVKMEFNFYSKLKVLFLYMHYGYIDKYETAIRKHCHQNDRHAVFGVFS